VNYIIIYIIIIIIIIIYDIYLETLLLLSPQISRDRETECVRTEVKKKKEKV